MADPRRPIRLDDLGASSKAFEYWSRHRWANVWPLHDRRLFGAWGPYRELNPGELEDIFGIVEVVGATITVAITACWVEHDGELVPYPTKFPAQAETIKWWVDRGAVKVASHGLTHCVPGRHRPRWVGGNRRWHRESECEVCHLSTTVSAQTILSGWLGRPVTRNIVPGQLAAGDPDRVFHDRDFVLDWDRAMRALKEALGCAA